MLPLVAIAQEYTYIDDASYNNYISNDFIELSGCLRSMSIMSFYKCWLIEKVLEDEIIEEDGKGELKNCALCNVSITSFYNIGYFYFHDCCAKICLNIMHKVLDNYQNDSCLTCKDFLGTTKLYINNTMRIDDPDSYATR